MTFADLWTGYLWPLIIIVAESVLLMVVLLVAIAYILLADRKIWAAVQIRRAFQLAGNCDANRLTDANATTRPLRDAATTQRAIEA